jgi:hypothetical protein
LSEAEPDETVEHANGRRFIKKGPRGKSGNNADDYYYSGETGKPELKDAKNTADYYYDTKDNMFRKYGENYGPGKAGLYACDYVFSQKEGMYLPKSPKEMHRTGPNDWYY